MSRKSLSIPERACVLIYIGSNFYRKGLRQVICSIAKTDRYLIVVGGDKNFYKYQSLANSLNCLSRIRFVGVKNQVLMYYHASDGLILPTLYDPFPNVILEAMSCGLPIITSNKCGAIDFIENEKNGFICDALDEKGLEESISYIPPINKNPNMGLLARKKVIKRSNPKKFFKKIFQIYQEIK